MTGIVVDCQVEHQMTIAVMRKGEPMDNLISKLSELRSQYSCFDESERDAYHTLSEAIEALSTDIIRCKDCRKHNQGINEAPYLADRCPLIIHRGYAKGHEFDYQFCCFGEREEQ